ncbi:FHA domain-containing protein [Mycetocola miduiensis]|uniref:FHA domain-containing protein n=1 Tax=Mycetocola miduiensis TaxID=995034 RepID=A0A1I5D291_9MICO|nr:FHA domain-containing protein [Mycetocola miduiensis]SFN93358.1 FHA domain-containing protein [Mycetocola miduiensis]
MTGYSYEPAQAHEWLAVATAGRLLVARVDDNSERVAQLAATGDPSTSVQGVLEVLTADGLGATGPFALLFWVDGDLTDKGLGVIVRGDAAVIVDTSDGEVTVSSRGVTTWTEQVIESPTGFRVQFDASSPSGLPQLPLQQGAAWVRRVQLAGVGATGSAREGTGAASRTSARKSRRETAAAAVEQAPVAPTAAKSAVPAGPAPVHEETRVFHTSTGSGAPATAEAETEADGYDYLFGATVFRPIGAAAVLADDDEDAASSMPETHFLSEAEAPPRPAAPGPVLGDHDGRTMLAADIMAARKRPGSGSAPTSGPTPNAPRPPAHRYVLSLPEGKSQALSAPVILGRAPSVSNVPASVLPHLVTLVGDDISRSHLRVAVEGDTVVVTDLHSSNGTHIIAPGKLPQLLRAGEPTPVITGTTIDLGSDVLLHVTEA